MHRSDSCVRVAASAVWIIHPVLWWQKCHRKAASQTNTVSQISPPPSYLSAHAKRTSSSAQQFVVIMVDFSSRWVWWVWWHPSWKDHYSVFSFELWDIHWWYAVLNAHSDTFTLFKLTHLMFHHWKHWPIIRPSSSEPTYGARRRNLVIIVMTADVWCARWCNKGHNHRRKSHLHLHKNWYHWWTFLGVRYSRANLQRRKSSPSFLQSALFSLNLGAGRLHQTWGWARGGEEGWGWARRGEDGWGCLRGCMNLKTNQRSRVPEASPDWEGDVSLF